MKHICPKFFYTHKLQKKDEIDVKQVKSNDNLVGLFTKFLPLCTLKKLINDVGMKHFKDL